MVYCGKKNHSHSRQRLLTRYRLLIMFSDALLEHKMGRVSFGKDLFGKDFNIPRNNRF